MLQCYLYDPTSVSASFTEHSRRDLFTTKESRTANARRKTVDGQPNPRCRFIAWDNSCDRFPCEASRSYNSIGFDIEHNGERPVRFKTATVLYARARESLILDLESSSVRRPLKTSNDQTSRKILSLKQIIEQMKVKSERNRPQDWCVNYGKPISMRKLLKVARPTSRDVHFDM